MIILNQRIESKPKGWTALKCSYCERVQPFCYFQKISAHGVFFVDVYASAEHLVFCEFCETGVSLEAPPRFQTRWNREDGLSALAGKTNPELLPEITDEPVTETQIQALLLTISKRTGLENVSMQIGMGTLLGFFGSFFIAVVTGFIMDHFGAFKGSPNGLAYVAILGGTTLSFFGCLVGLYWDGIRLRKRRLRLQILDAVTRKQLDQEAVKRIAPAVGPNVALAAADL